MRWWWRPVRPCRDSGGGGLEGADACYRAQMASTEVFACTMLRERTTCAKVAATQSLAANDWPIRGRGPGEMGMASATCCLCGWAGGKGTQQLRSKESNSAPASESESNGERCSSSCEYSLNRVLQSRVLRQAYFNVECQSCHVSQRRMVSCPGSFRW